MKTKNQTLKFTENLLSNFFITENSAFKKTLSNQKYSNVSYNIVMVPENFKGMYKPYIDCLHGNGIKLMEDSKKSSTILKEMLGYIINEMKTSKFNGQLLGFRDLLESAKLTETCRKDMATFFKGHNTKGKVNEVISGFKDFDYIDAKIFDLHTIFTEDNIKNIVTIVDSCSELVETFMELNKKHNLIQDTNSLKQDLVRSIRIVADETELLAAYYSNIFIFNKCYKSLKDSITTHPV